MNTVSATNSPAFLRTPTLADAAAIARLADELGYSASASMIEDRLARLLPLDRHFLRVAENSQRVVVGWLHAAEEDLLESGRRCEILGLVVAATTRGQGIGRALVAAAEAWATQCGLPQMSVRSNTRREETHSFYLGLGYTQTKTQHVYRKRLPGGRAG
jgi:GNAT superfamily N-acetyltransferase